MQGTRHLYRREEPETTESVHQMNQCKPAWTSNAALTSRTYQTTTHTTPKPNDASARSTDTAKGTGHRSDRPRSPPPPEPSPGLKDCPSGLGSFVHRVLSGPGWRYGQGLGRRRRDHGGRGPLGERHGHRLAVLRVPIAVGQQRREPQSRACPGLEEPAEHEGPESRARPRSRRPQPPRPGRRASPQTRRSTSSVRRPNSRLISLISPADRCRLLMFDTSSSCDCADVS